METLRHQCNNKTRCTRLRQGILRNYYTGAYEGRFTFEGVEPIVQGMERNSMPLNTEAVGLFQSERITR